MDDQLFGHSDLNIYINLDYLIMSDERKTFICQIDTFSLNLLDQFDYATQQLWKNMYELHISVFTQGGKNINKEHGTRYIDYAKEIRDNKIQIPVWYILTSGTMVQKLIPDYMNTLDVLSIGLMDAHTVRGKTMMCIHTSEMMQRNGMHVSDTMTQNIMKAFSNPHGLTYIRLFSASPEECFFIKDHYMSYYQHLKYGLLEENLLRIMAISARHLLLLIEILHDRKIDLVREIIQINPDRGKYLYEVLCDPKNDSLDDIFIKIWPRLKSIIMIKHGTMSIYATQLKRYIQDIETYCPVYAIPEVTFGYDRDNTGTYTLDPRNGFFEFVKIDETTLSMMKNIDPNIGSDKLKDIKIANIRTLEIGSLYHIVVTNKNTRLKRYLTDEIVKIEGYSGGSPRFKVQCKEYELLSINQRIITPYQIENVLMNHFNIIDYCYSNSDQNKLIIYVEIEKHDYLSDTKRTYDVRNKIKKIKIKTHILDQLNLNTDVKIIGSGTINMLYQNRYSDYVDPGSVHIPRNVKDRQDIDILINNVIYTY